MEIERERLYTCEDLKKSFDMGFESAVSLIEESLSISQDGQRLLECIEKKTFLSKCLRKIVFKRAFNCK